MRMGDICEGGARTSPPGMGMHGSGRAKVSTFEMWLSEGLGVSCFSRGKKVKLLQTDQVYHVRNVVYTGSA